MIKRKSGFTLLETVIVIGIISFILPVIFSIVFSITRQQAKVYVLSTVKREGDNALSIIENTIRNQAVSLHNGIPQASNKICTDTSIRYPATGSSNGSDFYFYDKSGEYFRFRFLNATDEIASSSSISNASVDLTSDTNTRVSNFAISCNQTSEFTPPLVDISFTIEQKQTTSTRIEDIASLNYSTKIKLRNY